MEVRSYFPDWEVQAEGRAGRPSTELINRADEWKPDLVVLRAAGLTAEEVDLLTGEGGARRIGVSDEGREVSVHIFRPTQEVPAFYDAPVIARRVEQELQAGHCLVGVTAKDGEAREREREILKSHGGHFINFYGRLAAEALAPCSRIARGQVI